MTDAKVTVTEVDNTEWAARGFPGFDEWSCTASWVCTDQPVGGYLGAHPDSDEDTEKFTMYYEIVSEFPTGKPDVDRLCEDCFAYLSQLAPAIVQFDTPTERST